jgi:hypothetical protein
MIAGPSPAFPVPVSSVTSEAAYRKEAAHDIMSFTTGRLAQALLKPAGVSPPYVQDPSHSILSPIMTLISWIYYLPIVHRKALLDACRIQAPIWVNKTLSSTFGALPNVTIHSTDGIESFYITSGDLAIQFDQIVHFPILCSLLSYFVRAEGTILRAEFLLEKEKGLDKELGAALYYETNEQVLDYTGLLGVTSRHLHPQLSGNVSWRLGALFAAGIRHICQSLSSTSFRPLLPQYNSRKNVSLETCRNYYEAIGDSIVDGYSSNVTTLDLLKLYYHTRIKISGCLEMRLAWFFNDLKPRIYYCMGGTDFFNGMYIQSIANMFCCMLPSTNPFTRFTVSRIGPLTYDDLLITYDYSSFTTSLAELKYFMFWLAEAVEESALPFLDVVEGIQTVPLREILHTYNQSVNIHQVFSIERFQNAEDEYIRLRQGRGGSLGVKGNIVFSTTLHGLALSDATGTPDDDCCVGDDALAKIRAWTIAIFISCVNNLGDINPTKFTTLRPIHPDEEISLLSEQFKFLKRPLNIDVDSRIPVLGILDFFPSVADALFPAGDGVHTATPGYSHFTSARTFAMQVGRYLRLHCDGTVATKLFRDDDIQLVLCAFQAGYRVYNLPYEGGIPGDFVVKWETNSRVGDFFCPPVDSPWVFDTPWMELLLNRFYGRRLSTPVTLGGTVPPPLEIVMGQRFHATTDVTVLQLGVDIGFLDKTVELRWECFDENVALRTWEKMMGGGKNLEPLYALYEVVAPPPSWWYDIVSYEYPDMLEEDPLDAVERISSIMSGPV